MTREDLKRQVLARVNMPAEFSVMAEMVLEDWLKDYPAWFVLGPAEILSVERLLRRELNHAQRKVSAARRATNPQ